MSKAKVTLLYADENGEIFDAPGVQALGRTGHINVPLRKQDLLPLPDTADLMFLPQRMPLGIQNDEIIPIAGQAVAAILPAGYTRTYLPAFMAEENAVPLPLYGYTAVALYRDELYMAALYTDKNDKWDPAIYNDGELKARILEVEKLFPHNRLVKHLAHCSLEWHCCTAQNMFYGRWEAGIPTSPVCNAHCLGCISLQESQCCASPQSRITFRPTVEEVTEIGSYHLQRAPEAIISFGQGCEGEPSLAYQTIAPAIRAIRQKTLRGQININTNAGFTTGIEAIVDAGLDSMRVSIISAVPENYAAYYRSNYSLLDVQNSIRYAKEHGVHISLNMLYFPGFNDNKVESAAWRKFLRETPVDMVQVRNLNIDPDYFLERVTCDAPPLGTKMFLGGLKGEFPHLTIGSFSHYQNNEKN